MNDNHEIDEAYEETRNHRVAAALDGLLVAGLRGITDEIVGLLVSEQEITREVRDKLAAAFVEGRAGYQRQVDNDDQDKKPKIFIRGGGMRRRLCEAVVTRRNWMDAYEHLLDERAKGRKGSRLVTEIAGKYGISSDHLNKDVFRFYKEFKSQYDDANSDLAKAAFAQAGPHEEDYEHVIRSLFVERKAEEEVGETFASFDLGLSAES